ncbi:MAG TPA: PilZ domain-containing protein [Candidatus Dormibacteraeota bacterium]|nr:PilZ domain-containing protein [Candidatus Dormibacteraeota bacterium]
MATTKEDVAQVAQSGVRQSDRVSFTLALEAIGSDASGQDFIAPAHTILVSRNGAVLLLKTKLAAGQELLLRRKDRSNQLRAGRAQVIAEIDKNGDGFVYAVALEDPAINLWDIEFPPLEESEETLARMLVECSFCQRREVAYLNEKELKAFEARRCLARHCPHCGTPAIFTQAQEDSATTANTKTTSASAPAKIYPSRNRTRVKARILACIRQRGFSEEVAVCEDLSSGGLSFRSRNQYAEGTRVEVAVPFTPGSGNIFVPIRIVFSQEMPTAGLYRHGAAYIKAPANQTS